MTDRIIPIDHQLSPAEAASFAAGWQDAGGQLYGLADRLDQLARDATFPAWVRQLAQELLDAGLAGALSTAGVGLSTAPARLSTARRQRGRA